MGLKVLFIVFLLFIFRFNLSFAVNITEENGNLIIKNSYLEFVLNLSSGTWNGKLDGIQIYRNITGTIGEVSTANGFSGYNSYNISDGIGTGKEVVLNINTGGVLSLRVYDNEYFFIAGLSKSGATGTAQITGEFLSGLPVAPVVWIAISDKITNDTENQRPAQFPMGDSQQSEKAIVCFDGYDRPGIIIGVTKFEPAKQKAELTRTLEGFQFRAWSDTKDGVGESFAFFSTKKILEGMERYAEIVQILNNIKFTEWIPCGFCTWNTYWDHVTKDDVLFVADQLVSTKMRDYGYTLLQIDDGWQYGWRCSGSWWANEKFGGGATYNDKMKETADEIHRRGLVAGLWIGPLMDEDDPDWRPYCWGTQHKEFINPQPEDCSGGGKYDVADPDFIAWAPTLSDRITRIWGFEYIKFDFMNRFSGYGTPQEMRNAYKLFREGSKPGSFFLYSNARQWDAAGFIDGIRAGDDVAPNFNYQVHSIGRTIKAVALQWYMNRKIWITDIDQIHVKVPNLSYSQACIWATIGGLSGGILMIPDRFWDANEVPPERLELLKKIAPPYGVSARPVDLFEHNVENFDFPNIYILEIKKAWGNYYVIAVINWDTTQKSINVDFKKYLDVPATEKFLAFNYWDNVFEGVLSDSCSFTLSGHNCKVLSLVPELPIPQIVSTSRHITQGGIDLENIIYNSENKEMTGTSKFLVRGEPYSIILHLPQGFNISSATAQDRQIEVISRSDGLSEIKIIPEEEKINWVVHFTGSSADTNPPSPVTDLIAIAQADNSILLSWTATGDDGNTGKANLYDIRYSFKQINNEVDFENSIHVTDGPLPSESGTKQNYLVKGLVSGTTYFFRMKVIDDSFNYSGLSNSAQSRTYGETQVSSITLMSPNGGENWYCGSVAVVTWSSQGAVGNLNIDFSTDAGNTWVNLVRNTYNDGCETVIVPGRSGSSCKVRISEVDGVLSDFSDNFFVIINPGGPILSVDISSMDFGEVKIGERKTLNFSVKNSGIGILTGKITKDTEWIEISPETLTGNNTVVSVTVDNMKLNQKKGQYSGKIFINTNGGSTEVDVVLKATCILTRPNPFSSDLEALEFFGSGIVKGKTEIKIWTVSGELVAEFPEKNNLDNFKEYTVNSQNIISWNGKNTSGKKITPGIYIYTYSSPVEKGIGKFTAVK